MTEEWTGGIVTDRGGDGPPTVAEWEPVLVPGRPRRSPERDRSPIERGFRTLETTRPERAMLELRGAYDRAEIWLNGTRLATHEPHFVPASLEFDPRPANELIVVCERPESFAGIYGTDAVPDRLGTPGIWWVSRSNRGPGRSSGSSRRDRDWARPGTRPRARRPPRPGSRTQPLTAVARRSMSHRGRYRRCRRRRGDAVAATGGVSRGGASMERIPIETEAGERTTVSGRCRSGSRRCGGPRGYGPQHRTRCGRNWAVTPSNGPSGSATSNATTTACWSTVGTSAPAGSRDCPAVIRARTSAGPSTRTRRCFVLARTSRDKRSTRPATRPGSRLAGSARQRSRASRRPGIELASALVETYGHHPSLAMGRRARSADGSVRTAAGKRTTRKLAVRYRAWRTAVDHGSATEIAAALPDGLPVVPVTGPPGTDPDASHLFPGWQYLEAADIDWLCETYPELGEIVGGFGAGALADDDADPTAVPGLESALLERGATGVEGSQREQVRTLKTVAEALRRRAVASSPRRRSGIARQAVGWGSIPSTATRSGPPRRSRSPTSPSRPFSIDHRLPGRSALPSVTTRTRHSRADRRLAGRRPHGDGTGQRRAARDDVRRIGADSAGGRPGRPRNRRR